VVVDARREEDDDREPNDEGEADQGQKHVRPQASGHGPQGRQAGGLWSGAWRRKPEAARGPKPDA
jgi:hypothetical protein